MKKYGAKLDMRGDSLDGGEIIKLQIGESGKEPCVAKVIVSKRRVVPPNSVAQVQCILSEQMRSYMVQPEPELRVMIPRTVHSRGEQAVICMVNPTEKLVTVKKS